MNTNRFKTWHLTFNTFEIQVKHCVCNCCTFKYTKKLFTILSFFLSMNNFNYVIKMYTYFVHVYIQLLLSFLHIFLFSWYNFVERTQNWNKLFELFYVSIFTINFVITFRFSKNYKFTDWNYLKYLIKNNSILIWSRSLLNVTSRWSNLKS